MSTVAPVGPAVAAPTPAPAPYVIGARVRHPVASAYEPAAHEPAHRRLRIFALDPAASELEGKTAIADVPYEPVEDGPTGRLFEVDAFNYPENEAYRPARLDEPSVLLGQGYPASESEPRFHAQMVYAVANRVHADFRRALGRQIGWSFASSTRTRLVLRPFAAQERNAWYDRREGAINFGYFDAARHPVGRTLPKGYVYTALSHDIVAHETAHALLDALRSGLGEPGGAQLAGFHEGFADLVALFSRFAHRGVLRKALADCRGGLRKPESVLCGIGHQFAQADGRPLPLRGALDQERRLAFASGLTPHALGQLLLVAVFEAFATVFERKTDLLVRLATNGTGELPPGQLPDLLVDALADKSAKLASQFLAMLIRAVDYLPPVDVTLGEYLRAIITADCELSSRDRWRFREALVDAFRARQIYPEHVRSLNEDSLLWQPPQRPLPAIARLSFATIRFRGDPGRPVAVVEQLAQAHALGRYVIVPEHLAEFGLVAAGDERLEGDAIGPPRIESIRTLRRPGPDGRVVFDTVAEIVQTRTVRPRDGESGFEMCGGATVIVDSLGVPRLVIRKSVVAEGRVQAQREFLAEHGERYGWRVQDDRYVRDPAAAYASLCLHQAEAPARG